MKENKKSFLVSFFIMYILFGLFPGARIKYISPIEYSKLLASLDYFIKNAFHLWQIKVVASIGAIFINCFIRFRVTKKYSQRNKLQK